MYERQNYDLMGEVYKYDSISLRKYYQDTEKHKSKFALIMASMRGKLTEREKEAIDYFLKGTKYDNERKN